MKHKHFFRIIDGSEWTNWFPRPAALKPNAVHFRCDCNAYCWMPRERFVR